MKLGGGTPPLTKFKSAAETLDIKYRDNVVLLYSGKISGDSATIASNITPKLGEYFSETYDEYKSFSITSNDGTKYRKLIFELNMPYRKSYSKQSYNRLYVRYGIGENNCVSPFATVIDIGYNRQWSINGTIDITDGSLGVAGFNSRINYYTQNNNPQLLDNLQSKVETKILPSSWNPLPITYLGFNWYNNYQGIPSDTTLTLYGIIA